MIGKAWWYMPVILVLGRLRQKDLEFETSLGHVVSSRLTWYIVRP
jgi:hypothetical protein